MSSDKSKALLYSTLLALQFGLQPLLTTYFTAPNVSKRSIVVGQELGKIVISVVTLLFDYTKLKTIAFEWRLTDSLYYAAVPAILYAVQNTLVQIGYTLVDSMTFNLLNQTKTLSAALWLYIMLGQQQSGVQIFALFLLLIAALALNFKSFTLSTSGEHDQQYRLGVVVVLGASMLSGISAAFVQKAFLPPKPRNPLLLSSELAVYGIAFLVISEYFTNTSKAHEANIFKEWDLYTLIPVAVSAAGGLVVGFVTKYAGGVAKGFALIAGLLLTALSQWVVENKPLGAEHWISAALVSISIYLHTTYPVKKKTD